MAIDAITTEKLSKYIRRNVKYKAYTTMNELIKVAEELYKQIDKLQRKLASNLSDDDSGTLLRTECFMLNIINHKDNIVDLSEVWKDGKKEKPLPYSEIVVRDCCITTNHEDIVDESQWAYLSDLLPKGGKR